MSLLIIPSFIEEIIMLLSAFNSKQEAQINEFQSTIDEHTIITEVKRWQQRYDGDEVEPYIDQIEHIGGFSDEDYNVRDLFLKVMPTYQRQAMLLTLWAAFEFEMEKMCIAVSSINNNKYTIPKKTKPISKFIHLISELKKQRVPSNPSVEFDRYVRTLDSEVRVIRNAWAHDGGVDIKNKLLKGIPGITTIDSQLAISKEYIDKVIELMTYISQELNSSAQPLFVAAINTRKPVAR